MNAIPIRTYAAEKPQYQIGDTVNNVTGENPPPVEDAVWILNGSTNNKICGVAIEHIHNDK